MKKMDYEKMYKAVLETAKQWVKDGCSDKERICLECIFPELRESEDERIRNLLVWQVHRNIEDETNDLARSVYDGIKGHDPDLEESIEDWKKCLAWLERQKDFEKELAAAKIEGKIDGINEVVNNPSRYNLKKENSNLADSIPSDCASDAKCEISSDYPIGFPFDSEVMNIMCDVAQGDRDWKNPQDVKFCSDRLLAIIHDAIEKQKEREPTEIDEYEIIKKHITEGGLSSEVNKRLAECGWYVTEQKPVEKVKPKFKVGDLICSKDGQYEDEVIEVQDGAYRLKNLGELYLPEDEWELKDAPVDGYEFIDKTEPKSINRNNLTWKDICELEEIMNEVRFDYRGGGIGQKSFGLEVLERFHYIKGDELDVKEQKPAEWSEEDEVIMREIIDILQDNANEALFYPATKLLKSLRARPHWKPSEEQMAALKQWLKDKQFDGASRYVYHIFESLYEQLKKLM